MHSMEPSDRMDATGRITTIILPIPAPDLRPKNPISDLQWIALNPGAGRADHPIIAFKTFDCFAGFFGFG